MSELTITVPASSANIGPGFDSAGVAINRYLRLQVNTCNKWEIIHNSNNLPIVKDFKSHLVYQVAIKMAAKYNKHLPSCVINMESNIPLARGLGSSAAAVVAGIELANQLCDLLLTSEQKLHYATIFEGHADNVAPALFGGFVITAKTKENNTNYISLQRPNMDIVLFIPNFELKTTEARSILPKTLPYETAAKANGISNLMIASFLAKDYVTAGQMMEQDLFHEPYRAKLIPHYDEIIEHAKKDGAYGTVISGAGPTMISFVPKGKGINIAKTMKEVFPSKFDIIEAEIVQQGVQVFGSV